MDISVDPAHWLQPLHGLREKEKGIKEGMYLMGMRRSAYWVSWLLTYAAMLLITALIMVGSVSSVIGSVHAM